MSEVSRPLRARRWVWLLATLGGPAALLIAVFYGNRGDFQAYWQVDLVAPYARTFGIQSPSPAFLYSPVAALLAAPLSSLTWIAAQAVWLALEVAVMTYIGGTWGIALMLFYPLMGDIMWGNIYVFLAAMIVAGRRHPEAFVFGLLTKVTPVIGLLFYVGKRDWSALRRVALITAAIVAFSVLVQGIGVWQDWFAMLIGLLSAPSPTDALLIPLVPRLIAAAVIALWGGATDRYWTVLLATVVAMPTLWQSALIPLIAFANAPIRSALLHVFADGAHDRRVGRPRAMKVAPAPNA